MTVLEFARQQLGAKTERKFSLERQLQAKDTKGDARNAMNEELKLVKADLHKLERIIAQEAGR